MHYALSLPNGGAWADPLSLAELAHVAEDVALCANILLDRSPFRNPLQIGR